MDAFLRLLEKKSFAKVTVRDIVEECGVNRTTFYYYYQDIYAIVEDLIASALSAHAAVLEGNPHLADLRDARDFAMMHRKALSGLYTALGHEKARRYIFAVMDAPMHSFIERHSRDLSLSEERKRTVFLFVREALLGALCLFLSGELPVEDGGNFLMLTHGMVRLMLENAAKSSQVT
jgi:AcrR family transcriptional regulator